MTALVAETSVKVTPGQMIDILARVVDQSGTILAASDFSSITIKIFNRRDLATPIVIGGSSVTSIAIPTSQATGALTTTGGWDEDDKGYNFSYSYDSSTFLSGGNKYVVDIKMTTASLGIIHVLVNLHVQRVYQ